MLRGVAKSDVVFVKIHTQYCNIIRIMYGYYLDIYLLDAYTDDGYHTIDDFFYIYVSRLACIHILMFCTLIHAPFQFYEVYVNSMAETKEKTSFNRLLRHGHDQSSISSRWAIHFIFFVSALKKRNTVFFFDREPVYSLVRYLN